MMMSLQCGGWESATTVVANPEVVNLDRTPEIVLQKATVESAQVSTALIGSHIS